MLRDRLREMDMRITELADYLKISRPTMYKYIDCYDEAKFDLINKDVLAVFNYIVENELVGKKSVIGFLLSRTKPTSNSESSVINEIEKYLAGNPDSKKSKFLRDCFFDENFNDIICYLADITKFIKTDVLSETDIKKIQPFLNLKNELKTMEEN